MIEAYKWVKNGDHPNDDCCLIKSEGGTILSEGKVVRHFHHPEIPGDILCQHCDNFIHLHGWIDKPNGGQKVCPGDIIIKNDAGEWEAFRKDWEYDARVNKNAVPCEPSEEIPPVEKNKTV